MFSRFNFYDFYAYLIPGLTAVALCVLPFMLGGLTLPVQFTVALVAAVAGYVVGLLLQEISRGIVPIAFDYVIDGNRELRAPSDYVIEESCPWWSSAYRARVVGRVRREFDLSIDGSGSDDEDLSVIRKDAFMACRARLVVAKKAVYVEQIQGMYGMFRGVGVALGLAGCAWLGCFAAGGLTTSLNAPVILLGSVLILSGVLRSRFWKRRLEKLERIGQPERWDRGARFSVWWKNRLRKHHLRRRLVHRPPELAVACVMVLCGAAAILSLGGRPALAAVVASLAALVYSRILGRYAVIVFIGFAAVFSVFSLPETATPFAPAAAAAFSFLSMMAFRSYRRFAEEFARSVYQFFLVVTDAEKAETNVALGARQEASDLVSGLL